MAHVETFQFFPSVCVLTGSFARLWLPTMSAIERQADNSVCLNHPWLPLIAPLELMMLQYSLCCTLLTMILWKKFARAWKLRLFRQSYRLRGVYFRYLASVSRRLCQKSRRPNVQSSDFSLFSSGEVWKKVFENNESFLFSNNLPAARQPNFRVGFNRSSTKCQYLFESCGATVDFWLFSFAGVSGKDFAQSG